MEFSSDGRRGTEQESSTKIEVFQAREQLRRAGRGVVATAHLALGASWLGVVAGAGEGVAVRALPGVDEG